MNRNKKVGLLGGTFNPPHLGHLYAALKLREEFNLDEIVFIPLGDPPHKKNLTIASSGHRLNMLRLMTEDYPFITVSDIEIKRRGYTYTIDTLSELKAQYPNDELYYIIGSDTLFQLTSWKSFESVFKLTSFLCLPRPGDNMADILQEHNRLKEAFGAKIIISSFTGPDISSTEVRETVKKGLSTNHLDDKVFKYIKRNHVFN